MIINLKKKIKKNKKIKKKIIPNLNTINKK